MKFAFLISLLLLLAATAKANIADTVKDEKVTIYFKVGNYPQVLDACCGIPEFGIYEVLEDGSFDFIDSKILDGNSVVPFKFYTNTNYKLNITTCGTWPDVENLRFGSLITNDTLEYDIRCIGGLRYFRTMYFFNHNSSELIGYDSLMLDSLSSLLSQHRRGSIQFTGSAEPTEKSPDSLSLERAKAVKKHFLSKGVKEYQICELIGAGTSQRRAYNVTREGLDDSIGRSWNRFVDYEFIYCVPDSIFSKAYIKIENQDELSERGVDSIQVGLYEVINNELQYIEHKVVATNSLIDFEIEVGADYKVNILSSASVNPHGRIWPSVEDLRINTNVQSDTFYCRLEHMLITPLRLHPIYFKHNSSEIRQVYASYIDSVYIPKFLDIVAPEYIIEVYGHAEPTETKPQKLSLQRAKAVASYLEKKGCLNFKQVKAIGNSTEEPLKPNTLKDGSDNPEGRAYNRRVQFHLDTGEE